MSLLTSVFQLYYFEYNGAVFTSSYFKHEYYNVSVAQDLPDSIGKANPKQLLSHAPDLDEIETNGYNCISPATPTSYQPASESLFGARYWRGSYDANGFTPSIGHIDMNHLPAGGQFMYTGVDSMGDFVVEGSRNGTRITFTRRYKGQPASYTYQGEINEDEDEIIGSYGLRTDPREGLADEIGTFKLERRPIPYFLYRPMPQELTESRPKALWRFALTAVLHDIRMRSTRVPWEFFAERRARRRRYVELYMKYDEWVGNWKEFAMLDPLTKTECEEWSLLEISSTTADLLFNRSLANFLSRREVGFLYVALLCRRCHRTHHMYSDIACNGCDRKWLPMTRILCLECSSAQDEGYVNSLDFCAPCANQRIIPDESGHTTSHHLLQLRRFVPSQLSLSRVFQAQDILSTYVPDEPECSHCENELSGRFWYCMECEGMVPFGLLLSTTLIISHKGTSTSARDAMRKRTKTKFHSSILRTNATAQPTE